MDFTTVVAFLGLLCGNLIRQLLPFIRKVIDEDIQWDHTYTRRFIYSMIAALIFAYEKFPTFVFPNNGLVTLFFTAMAFGVNMNWLIEELSKWEYSSGMKKQIGLTG